MIIDLDSHLREEYLLDEVYRLEGAFADKSPVRIGGGEGTHAKFHTGFISEPTRANRQFDHTYMYDPDENWQGGAIAERQQGGWKMDRRLRDMDAEGIEHQMIFPTRIGTPTQTPGEIGAALASAYNNWVASLVRGNEDRLWPVAMAPAGHPPAMAQELERCVTELGFKAAHLVVYTKDHCSQTRSSSPTWRRPNASAYRCSVTPTPSGI